MMDEKQIKELLELAEKATPRPWRNIKSDIVVPAGSFSWRLGEANDNAAYAVAAANMAPDLAREVLELRQREASYKQEIDDFNAGYAACKAGVPVENEPGNPSDMWRPGYAWAAFDKLRMIEAQFETRGQEIKYLYDFLIAQFPNDIDWGAWWTVSAVKIMRAQKQELDNMRQREAQARALFDTLVDLATIDEIEGTLPEDAAELAQKARAWMEGK